MNKFCLWKVPQVSNSCWMNSAPLAPRWFYSVLKQEFRVEVTGDAARTTCLQSNPTSQNACRYCLCKGAENIPTRVLIFLLCRIFLWFPVWGPHYSLFIVHARDDQKVSGEQAA